MPKTKLIPRYPWDRAPLGKFESVVMEFVRVRHAQGMRVPGVRAVRKEFSVDGRTAYETLKSLVRKGWLGEAGWERATLYINDEPKD